jgi:hypothetical protein
VNRKDVAGKNIFSGGFLGLDNIGVFDRSKPLPAAAMLEQADGTAWMAFYCLTMLSIALELAREDPAYEDVASKFFEHFVAIADAMNTLGGTGCGTRRTASTTIRCVDGTTLPLRVRSMVGLIPLFAVAVLEHDDIDRLPGFASAWTGSWRTAAIFIIRFPMMERAANGRTLQRLLAIPSRGRLLRVLKYAGRTRVSLAHSAFVRFPPPRASRSCCDRWRSSAWTTNRPNRSGCSAAIPTGADRSGFR